MFFKVVVAITLAAVVLSNDEFQESSKSKEISDRSHHAHPEPTYKGIWKRNLVWRPRWVKTWREKKVYVAVWKRMWGPVDVKEWVPIPKPPPGWIKPHAGPFIVKQLGHHKVVVKG